MVTVEIVGAALSLTAGVMAAAMAVVIYGTGPRRAANVLLAVVLFLEACLQAAGGRQPFFAQDNVDAGLQGVFSVAFVSVPWLYLAFLGTVRSPLSAPFRSRAARTAMVAAAVGVGAARVIWPSAFDVSFWSPFVFFGAVSLFSLAVAWTAYRRTRPGTLARGQARAYLLAFGARDVIFGTIIVVFSAVLVWSAATGLEPELAVERQEAWLDPFFAILPPLGTFLFVPLMAYGVLRARLLDIDVRIRWTVKQSTLAAAFVAVFFVVEQSVAAAFTRTAGTVLGILAAGALVFALAPLQRVAERLATAAVPPARPLSDLPQDERRTLYVEQARYAWEDGSLDRAERLMLDSLRERLGLTHDEASRLELEAAKAQRT